MKFWSDMPPVSSLSDDKILMIGDTANPEAPKRTTLAALKAFINNSFSTVISGLVPFTALSDYVKRIEVFTQAETLSLIGENAKIAFEKVDALPEKGESNLFYLTLKEGSTDIYEKHIFAKDAWVDAGEVTIDLNNYNTKEEINAKLIALPTKEEVAAKAETAAVYSKIEVDSKLADIPTKLDMNTAIAAIANWKRKIVEVLPEVGEENTLYLIAFENPEGDNYYDEYYFQDGKAEHFGNTKVDLTDYPKKSEIPSYLTEYVTKDSLATTLEGYATTAVIGNINTILDTINGEVI